MSEERNALVHSDELDAIKDSRKRGMPLFKANGDSKTLWIVAASEHQARLAMVDRIWPMGKVAKRDRDDRYTKLLEQVVADTASAGDGKAE